MDAHIGTSGWHYEHWRDRFYPSSLPAPCWLEHYAQHFDCVEVNSSFYRFPAAEQIRGWLQSTPQTFRFALKASRYITHQKKLKDCREPLRRFLNQADSFGCKLGPVLFQLPPRWHVNRERLTEFLGLLPQGMRFAMEFRDHSWHCLAVWELLAKHGVAWCQYDLQGFLATEQLTTDMVYLRLHGPGANAYCGSYCDSTLRQWATRVISWRQAEHQVWVLFDNDQHGHALTNAQRLRQFCIELAQHQ